MRVVSIGDLVIDYYYKDGKFLGINGGMTSHNIIANLAKKGLDTAVFGVCGNDFQGLIAIKSLKNIHVNVDNVKILEDIRTRCFHISYYENDGVLSFTSKKRCPFCNDKKWYEDSLIDLEDIKKNIDKKDILVFDNLNEKNQELINDLDNKKIVDLGQYFEFENLSNENIVEKIKNKFEIINFNERVTKYLEKRLNLKDDLELYHILNPKFMCVTRAEKGTTFIYNNEKYDFALISKGNVVDSTGAGDAFISSIIKDCIKNNFIYDVKLFDKWFANANRITTNVVSKMGARGHISNLFKVKKMNNLCTCENFIYNERKKIKRCNININNLETRILNALNSKATNKLLDMNFELSNNCLFIGTGGSFAAAYFASRVINEKYGCNTYPIYPRDVLYRNNSNIDRIFLFSYSGTTSDVINCVQSFNKNNIYIITKGELQKVTLKAGILKNNVISYRTSSNKGKERGFLSFEGAVAPATLFLKIFFNNQNNTINLEEFVSTIIKKWDSKICELINEKLVKKIYESKMINIFRGDYVNSACYDLESKIIESGLFNCIIHEKKNFSHGRFINYENLNNNYSIYFKQKTTIKYENELIKYLGNDTILIESDYDGILAEFDLLIASQFIIYYFGKYLNIDVSKPNFSSEAMNIYFYKGDL